MKIRTVNQPPLDKPSIHVMSQKEVVDNVKLLESIEEIMQPVRLEYVQLKRLIGARFYFGVSKADQCLAHRIQQSITKLQILNLHEI